MNYRVFYSCAATGDAVDSETPYSTDRDTMIAMAQQLLRSEGDYYGIIDENGVALQFMVENQETLWMEIPVPAEQGSYGGQLPFSELEKTLLALAPPFDPGGIAGLQFQPWR